MTAKWQKIEELKAGDKTKLAGQTVIVAGSPHFWQGHFQGKGYVVLHQESDEEAMLVVVYRGEEWELCE